MRKAITLIAAAAVFAQPLPDLAALEAKRAEYWRLNYLQIQIALQIQELRKKITAEAEKAGCTMDETLEQPIACGKPKK